MKNKLSSPMHLIWDDDGSPDGVIALLYFLHHPNVIVDAITVSYGQAHTKIFASLLPRMLARLGIEGIPVAAGRDHPLAGDNAFPEPWRIPTDRFWEIALPNTGEPLHPLPAAEFIIKIFKESIDPVTLFITGAHTNLAEALRLEPDIRRNITAVHVMGGALYVEGNIEKEWPEIHNKVAEWNIWSDPMAAKEVFEAGLPIHLTPLDATDQVIWTRDDADAWKASGSPEGVMAAEILSWMLDRFNTEGGYLWDLLTAVHTTDPDLCETENVHVQIETELGDEEGRTVVIGDQPPNLIASLAPQKSAVKKQVIQVFEL
jgi:purine nucleosidase/pyrimidine-specific ribonucleoside hydrolase